MGFSITVRQKSDMNYNMLKLVIQCHRTVQLVEIFYCTIVATDFSKMICCKFLSFSVFVQFNTFETIISTLVIILLFFLLLNLQPKF